MAQQIQMTVVSQFPLYKLTEAEGKDRNSRKQRLQSPRVRAHKTPTCSNFKMILKQKVQKGDSPSNIIWSKNHHMNCRLTISKACPWRSRQVAPTSPPPPPAPSSQLVDRRPSSYDWRRLEIALATMLQRYSSLQLPVSPQLCALLPLSIRDW